MQIWPWIVNKYQFTSQPRFEDLWPFSPVMKQVLARWKNITLFLDSPLEYKNLACACNPNLAAVTVYVNMFTGDRNRQAFHTSSNINGKNVQCCLEVGGWDVTRSTTFIYWSRSSQADPFHLSCKERLESRWRVRKQMVMWDKVNYCG
jgi:hypothetical protein